MVFPSQTTGMNKIVIVTAINSNLEHFVVFILVVGKAHVTGCCQRYRSVCCDAAYWQRLH